MKNTQPLLCPQGTWRGEGGFDSLFYSHASLEYLGVGSTSPPLLLLLFLVCLFVFIIALFSLLNFSFCSFPFPLFYFSFSLFLIFINFSFFFPFLKMLFPLSFHHLYSILLSPLLYVKVGYLFIYFICFLSFLSPSSRC